MEADSLRDPIAFNSRPTAVSPSEMPNSPTIRCTRSFSRQRQHPPCLVGVPRLSGKRAKAGDWKREGLDWDPRMTESRARAMAQVFDENEYRRWVLSRDVSAGKQVAGFLTQIAVGFTDPVNYIPVFGPAARAAAAARFGRVAGTAAVHSAEAALTTAAVQPLLLPSRQAFGDDVGFADAVMDVGFSALFGAAVGAGAGAWARWRGDPLVHDVGIQRTAAETLAAAADDVARGAAPDLKAVAPLLSPDAQKLRDAIRDIEANPVGDPLSPMVPLTTHDMQQVIVARGGFRNINSMEISKRGWGLVKVIWKHGWQSNEPDHLKVTEDDVLAFPEIIQTMEPAVADISPDAATAALAGNTPPSFAKSQALRPSSLTWVVERDSPFGPRRIIYGVNQTRHHADPALVTVMVVDPNSERAKMPLSQKIADKKPASLNEAGHPPEDTAVSGAQPVSRGQTNLSATDTIPPSGVEFTPNVMGRANLSPERAEALPDVDAVAADVLRPATPADLAAEMGLDLETGLFDGVERFRQLEAEGRITAEEAAEIRAAEEMMGKADKYAKAFEAAAICMGSRV